MPRTAGRRPSFDAQDGALAARNMAKRARNNNRGEPGDELAETPGNGGAESDLRDETDAEEIIVAFLMETDKIGIAYYSTSAMKLCVTSVRVPPTEVCWIIQVLKQQIPHPKLIITTSSLPEEIFSELKKPGNADSDDGTERPARPEISVAIVKKQTFSLDTAKKALASLAVHSPSAEASTRISDVGFASCIDTSDSCIMRTAGGLVTYLIEHRMLGELGDSDGKVELPGGLFTFSLTNFMHMDAATATSLSVFANQIHPCVIKAGRAKEGFSLYAMLDRTVSTPGRKLLKYWLQQPSLSTDVLEMRFDAVDFFMTLKREYSDVWKDMRSLLKKCRDITRIVLRINRARTGPSDWYALQQTLLAANMAKDAISSIGAKSRVPALVAEFQAACSSEATFLQVTLDAVIDWDTMREQGRVCVRPGLDGTLDEYRDVYAALPDYLSKVSLEELARYPSLSSLCAIYLPQIGCVISLDKADNSLAPSTADVQAAPAAPTNKVLTVAGSARSLSIIPDAFRLQYETTDAILYKNSRTDEIDECIGDIVAIIHDLEASIVRQLESKVLEFDCFLEALSYALAQIDVLMAFADASDDYNYTRPTLVDDNVIFVKNARHPLQEVTVETFVPNDIAIAPGRPVGAMSIVTGPNYSGKSIYLKTVGLIPIMAQIGCFVPAEKAVLGIVDRLFSRIQSLESASLNQSAFSLDLNQVGMMLRHATERSLLLIDEFGKGTNPLDGVALLVATVRSLLGCGASSGAGSIPKVVLTTHFREALETDLIFYENERDSHPQISFYQMQVLLETVEGQHRASAAGEEECDEAECNIDAVVPLFKLVPGQAASSYGLACAKKAGLPADAVARAAYISDSFDKSLSIIPHKRFLDSSSRKAAESCLKELGHLLASERSSSCSTPSLDELLALVTKAKAAVTAFAAL